MLWKIGKLAFKNAPILVFSWYKVGSIAKVEGVSMQPTMNPKGRNHYSDWVYLNKWSVREFEVSRGQVVAIKSPRRPSDKLIKRVTGLEGDYIVASDNDIIKIPKGHVWVEGDNSPQSDDSNHFGPVPLGLIDSRATWIIWPPSRWSKLEERTTKRKGVFQR